MSRTTKVIARFPDSLSAMRLSRGRINVAGLVAAAVAAAIVAATPPARGQNAPTASQGPSSAPAPASSTPSPSTPSSSSPADSSSSSAPSGNKSEPVCFKLTGHCVDSTKTAAKKSGSAAAKSGTGAKKPLNLTAPDVSTVVPEQELKEPLANQDEVTEVQESQTVSVKTDEGVPPEVPVGLGAIWWAVGHPSQAWRILTPE